MKKSITILLVTALFIGCKKKELFDTSPVVTTKSIDGIQSDLAYVNFSVTGHLENGGCSVITERGAIYRKTPNVEYYKKDGINNQGCALGGGDVKIFTLTKNTKYYVRAFALYTINGVSGVAYGQELSFTTLP